MVKSGAQDTIYAVKSLSWPKVTGTIVASGVDYLKGDPGYGEYPGSPDTYEPRIGYEYSVSGINYHSQKVRFGTDLTYFSRKKAERLVSTIYTSGKSVNVYHHPDKPEISILKRGLTPGIFLLLLYQLLVLGFGTGVIIGWLYAFGIF